MDDTTKSDLKRWGAVEIRENIYYNSRNAIDEFLLRFDWISRSRSRCVS